jgi:hypothetical protein
MAAEKVGKLRRAVKALRNLARGHSTGNWKPSVSAKHPDISPKFLNLTCVGIPVKVNNDSGGKPNGVPE